MPTANGERLALVVPTLNAGRGWLDCLAGVAAQSCRPDRLLVIDSSSSDDTIGHARSAGFEVVQIDRKDFNHGGTRQWAVDYLADCDVVVFLTQDAVLATPLSLSNLVDTLRDPSVAVAYGRQIPRKGASAMEAHARCFSYGDKTLRKDRASIANLGPKVYFSSNSFAAYRRTTLIRVGGFRPDLILGEDAEYAGRAVLAGFATVYCADATAYHSHDYSAIEQFRRYFDTGVFHARNEWLRGNFGSQGGEGFRFVGSELRYLMRHAPARIPQAIAHTFMKLIGYRLGRLEKKLPVRVKRCLSMAPRYWRPDKLPEGTNATDCPSADQ